MRKIFLIAFAVHGVLFAQTTWKGLRFGMSEAEVRKAYGGELHKEVSESQNVILVDNLELLRAPLKMRAKVELSLGKGDKLEVINIIAKDAFADEKSETNAKGATLAAVNELTTRLTDKYGNPTTEEGKCKPTAEMLLDNQNLLSCSKMWRSEGQNVKMFWSIRNGRLSAFILAYKPFPADI